MTKIFSATKLQEIVGDYDLLDVLDSLVENGLVETWELDLSTNEVSITIAKGAEIKNIIDTFQVFNDAGKKGKLH